MDELLNFIQKHLPPRHPETEIGVKELDDGAVTSLPDSQIVVTTDAHTIDPLFFPGGNIGKLTICGALNDCAAMGAKPRVLTLALIIEEGLTFGTLGQILDSLNKEATRAGVEVIAGDTKVLPKGSIKGMVMVTTMIGTRITSTPIADQNVQPGDKIILTGEIGNHGIALLSLREGLQFSTELESDVAALDELLLDACKQFEIHAMKDPTRGGLAAALNEFASKSQLCLVIEEEKIPIHPQVDAACEMLGLDPLEVANEGKAIIAVAPKDAPALLQYLRQHPLGKQAQIIGEAQDPDLVDPIIKHSGMAKGHVFLKTAIGGTRILEKPFAEPIPRVC